MTQDAVVVQHLPFEDLGTLKSVLEARGWNIKVLQAGRDELAPAALVAAPLLIVLGGPIGVHDRADYPFLNHSLDALRQRAADDRPTLGICLGAQLLAVAMGAQVTPGAQREVGWAPLQLTEAGRQSALAPLGDPDVQVFHWHSDVFGIPPGAERLAGTAACANQAFARGPRLLGLQFHPEVSAIGLEQWYIGNARDLQSHARPQVGELREAAQRQGPRLESAAAEFLNAWLDAASGPADGRRARR